MTLIKAPPKLFVLKRNANTSQKLQYLSQYPWVQPLKGLFFFQLQTLKNGACL